MTTMTVRVSLMITVNKDPDEIMKKIDEEISTVCYNIEHDFRPDYIGYKIGDTATEIS